MRDSRGRENIERGEQGREKDKRGKYSGKS